MKKMILRMAMCALVVCALPMALAAQDWQTSSMQSSGSAYSSQVTPVGAVTVSDMATTTSGNAPSRGPKRLPGDLADPGNQSSESPIGSEWALLLFAAIAGGGVFLRGRKLKIGN